MTVINASYACQTTLYRNPFGVYSNPYVTLYSTSHADAYMDAIEVVLGYGDAGYSARKVEGEDTWRCWNVETGERVLVRVLEIQTGGQT